MRRILLILGIICAMAQCGGCGSLTGAKESLPEDTIEEFEDAMNAMDVNGMMECLDESAVKSITAGMNLALGITGAISGIDLGISAEALIAAMPLFQKVAGAYGYEMEHPQVDFEVLETHVKGKRATVYITEVNSGESMAVNMKKADSVWKITLDTHEISYADAEQVIIAGQNEETDEDQKEKTEDFSIWDLLNQEKTAKLLEKLLRAE